MAATEGTLDGLIVKAVRSAVQEMAVELAKSVEKRMLSTQRTLAYLDISRSTLEVLIDEGKLHPHRYREGGAMFFKIAELEQLIEHGVTGKDKDAA